MTYVFYVDGVDNAVHFATLRNAGSTTWRTPSQAILLDGTDYIRLPFRGDGMSEGNLPLAAAVGPNNQVKYVNNKARNGMY